MNSIKIHIDGACQNNPGAGASAFVINNKIILYGGYQVHTTNNRMELQAAIESVKYIFDNYKYQNVEIYTDSVYVQKGITEWIYNWIRKQYHDVLNDDLWKILYEYNKKILCTWTWIPRDKNKIADKYAKLALIDKEILFKKYIIN